MAVSCDDCSRVQKKDDTDWFDIDLRVLQKCKSKDYEFVICPKCYERIVDPSPKGLLKRILSFLNN